jgi:hypothetical protein
LAVGETHPNARAYTAGTNSVQSIIRRPRAQPRSVCGEERAHAHQRGALVGG